MAKIYKTSLILLFFILFPFGARAASLSLSPSSGSYAVGQTLSVSAYVSSANQAMNAASGTVSFPADKLEVISLSKEGSIFNFWVSEPSFSNSSGAVNFEGIALSPGFTGSSGKLITAKFKVKAAGTAVLNFSSGSVLANDGNGTNILASLGNSQFTLGGSVPAFSPPAVSNTPAPPIIISDTHPDPNKWYASSDPKFSWTLPAGATGTKLLFNKFPSTAASIEYKPAISKKQLPNLKDGIWYFHVALGNINGWGKTANFRFQIDTEKPSRFDLKEIPREDPASPKAKFIFDAQDKTSGIDYFEIQIDGGNPEIWTDDGSHQYETPAVSSGEHALAAKAFDKAGNYTANSIKFSVEAKALPAVAEQPAEPTGKITAAKQLIVYMGILATNFLSLMVPLVALLFLLFFILWYGWHKFALLKMRFKKEIRDAESALYKAFVILKENILKQIEMLEKTHTRRQLTEEEDKIIRQDKKDLYDAEQFIKKGIDGIEKFMK